MKVAHVKTVDGTTQMIQFNSTTHEDEFTMWLEGIIEKGVFGWSEHNKFCYLYRQHIISVRFREVEDK